MAPTVPANLRRPPATWYTTRRAWRQFPWASKLIGPISP